MAAANHMHNLMTLIKRLEAATSRLEDIATSTELPKDAALTLPGASSSSTEASATATPRSAPQPAAAAAAAAPDELPESIEDFDAFVDSAVANYVKRSNDIGGLVARQAADVLAGFRAQRKFLLITTRAVRPDIQGADMALYQDLLKPINDALMAVTELKETNRSDPMYTQLSAVADGIMVLAWVTVSHKPFTHVEEFLGSAQFFGNRVIKEYKDKDTKQVDWIQSFYQIFKQLRDYVKQHFANGIPWNPKGEPAAVVVKALDSAPGTAAPAPPAPSAGGPPPPPPPGPPPVLDVKTENVAPVAPAAAGGLGAVFSELNKGDAVTKGLRKVDKSQMTHKNPALRANTTVPSGNDRPRSPAPGKKPKPESMRMKKPPKKELEGNKWTIENYEKEAQPIEIHAELSHSVLISRCNNTTIIVRGKANQVTVENSSRLSLVVETLVSTVDVVKAQNFALQVLGTIPTVMMDQVDSAQLYFSKESTGTKIFHSKSDGINLNVISGPDDDYREVPLPSQMCTYYDARNGDLVNEIVAHAG